MDRKEQLKSMLQNFIKDNDAGAKLDFHMYIADKMHEVSNAKSISESDIGFTVVNGRVILVGDNVNPNDQKHVDNDFPAGEEIDIPEVQEYMFTHLGRRYARYIRPSKLKNK